MKSAVIWIFCVFCVVLAVQARSIEKIEPGTESEMSKESKEKFYSKLLAYLQAQDFNDDKNNNNNNDDDDSDEDSSSDNDEIPDVIPKRAFFLFPNRRSSAQRLRPMHSYGRKSHWDTFFG